MSFSGSVTIAYPIQRQTEGFYAVTQFSAEPQAVRPLESSLDLAEDVLRHLVVKIEEVKETAREAKKRARKE